MAKQSKIDDLIGQLSDDLEPRKPLAHPLWRAAPLILISLIYVGATISMIGPREDWIPKMYQEIDYIFEFTLSLGIFITSTFALCWMCVPDMRGQQWVKSVPLTLAAVFCLWAALRIIFEWGQPVVFEWKNCSLDGFIMLMLPAAILTFASRRGSTTQPVWSSSIAVLAFCGLGWSGLRLTCGANTFLQSFGVNFIPFIVLGVIFGIFARRIFRW